MTSDPYFYNTSLLLKLDSDFSDSSSNGVVVTQNGGISLSAGESKYGGGSAYFDGVDDYLEYAHDASLDLSGGDWTVEGWIYPDGDYSITRAIIGKRDANGAEWHLFLKLTSGRLSLLIGSTEYNTTSTPAANQWSHVAAVHNGGTTQIYLNGVSVGLFNVAAGSGTAPVYVGNSYHGNNSFSGYIDDVRVTKGVARYTSAFTPPSVAHPITGPAAGGGGSSTPSYDPDFENVGLLLKLDTDFSDSSYNAHAPTISGGATVTSTVSKYGAGSAYFSGSNFVTYPASPELTIGTKDFTLEMWINRNGQSTSKFYMFNMGGHNPNSSYAFYVQDGYLRSDIYGNGLVSPNIDTVPGQWHHVAASRENGVMRMFVDGNLVATNNNAGDSLGSYNVVVGGQVWEQYNDFVGGYIDDLRLTIGVARYTANFTPSEITELTGPDYGDQYFDSVSLLLPMDSDFSDSSVSGHTVTTSGATAAISTTEYKYGGGSAFLDRFDHLTIPTSQDLQFGTGDFTIECWTKLQQNASPYPAIYSNYNSWQAGALGIYAGNDTDKYTVALNPVHPVITSTTTIQYNNWVHVALTRESGVMRLFINGNLEGSHNSSASLNGVGPSTWIGTSGDVAANGGTTGYFDDFRITKGVARYKASFTPPNRALPTAAEAPVPAGDDNYNNVSLLLKFDSDFSDSSSNGHVATVSGNTSISSSESKYGGSSAYFDGAINTGLSIPSSDAFDLRGIDWTMEAWINPDGNYGEDAKSIFAKRGYSLPVDYNLYQEPYSGQIIFWNGQTGGQIYSGVTPQANQWSHVAVARKDGAITIYVNGEAKASQNLDILSHNTTSLGIGNVGSFDREPFLGYIDDVRITKGVARYTKSFTAPGPHATSLIGSTTTTATTTTTVDNDYYPGTSTALGQIKFKFDLEVGDVICITKMD